MTGASGFVGGAIVKHLRDASHEVIGLSRRPADVEGLYGLLDANIADPAASRRIMERIEPCQAIVHAAAAIDARSDLLVLTNCLGTQQLLAVADAWQTRGFVFVSSLPVIGRPIELPITESHPVAPRTIYHATKRFGELLVEQRGAGAILRLTSPVGPGMPEERILASFVALALAGEPLEVRGAGTRRQDYVDVRDVAAAVEAALTRSGCFNIGSGRAISNGELARLCVSVLGSASAVEIGIGEDPDDGVDWQVSIARAAAELGYAPSYELSASIRGVACTTSRSPRREELSA